MTSKKAARRIGMFADVKDILDAAIASGGGEVTLETYGKAVHWRHRAYTFRKMYALQVDMNSPYDRLTFRRVEPGPDKTVPHSVLIDIIEQPAIFKPKVGGRPIVEDEEDDAYAEEAARLARELGID